jgi:DNA-binding NtrC family response regulator
MPPLSKERLETTRFLLIDADQARAFALSRALSGNLAPAAILRAKNGRQALDLLRAQTFDVALIDLASLGDLASIPQDAIARIVKLSDGALIVTLTNGGTISAAVEVMRAGAHDCIARPVAPNVLIDRIAILSRRHGRNRAPAMTTPMPVVETTRVPPQPLVLPMWRQEQKIIEEAIARFAGNVAMAAAALELSPSTIYRKRQNWADDEKRGAA